MEYKYQVIQIEEPKSLEKTKVRKKIEHHEVERQLILEEGVEHDVGRLCQNQKCEMVVDKNVEEEQCQTGEKRLQNKVDEDMLLLQPYENE